MTMIRLIAAASLAIGLGAPDVQAQSRLSTDVPAEFPPASFSARQYVDSRGCVYVRAGIDGNTTWVPRVSRDRTHLCGAKPTFATAAPAQAQPAPRAAEVITPRPAPAPAAAPRPAPRAAAAAPAPAPQARPRTTVRVTAPEPAPRPRATRKPLETIATPPRQVRAPASKPVAAPPPKVVRAVPKTTRKVPAPVAKQGACKGASAVSQKYINNGKGRAVRCGPQDSPHVTVIRRGEAPGPGKNVYINKPGWQDGSLRNNSVIVPRHVYENRVTSKRVIPEGYKPAFDDGRFNPRRAYQTVEGYKQTRLRWTNTVPRRLIDVSTGKDVTDRYPNIVYRVPGPAPVATSAPIVSTKSAPKPAATKAKPVVSTKSAPSKPARAIKGRFVEIGLFTKPDLAKRTATTFQRMGVPVKYGVSTYKGKQAKRVLLGPFTTQRALDNALSQARGAGYPQARIR